MKETIITVKRKKIELYALLLSFITAIILNIYSIIRFSTEWKELITQLPYVIILAIIIYLLSALLRWLYYLIKKPFIKK